MKFKDLLSEVSGVVVKNYVGVQVKRPDDSGVPDDAVKEKNEKRGNEYHITVISPPEYKEVFRHYIEQLRAENPDISKNQARKTFAEYWHDQIGSLRRNWKDLGVGHAKKGNDEAWFRVIDWPDADKLRKSLGLPDHDFHVTLGFRNNDVHGVRKDRSTLVDK